jgi:hypothetical protein
VRKQGDVGAGTDAGICQHVAIDNRSDHQCAGRAVLLTTGDGVPSELFDQIAFCRSTDA